MQHDALFVDRLIVLTPNAFPQKGAPTLSDLDETSPPLSETYWSFPFFRVAVVALSYFAFPLFLIVMKNFQTIDPEGKMIAILFLSSSSFC